VNKIYPLTKTHQFYCGVAKIHIRNCSILCCSCLYLLPPRMRRGITFGHTCLSAWLCPWPRNFGPGTHVHLRISRSPGEGHRVKVKVTKGKSVSLFGL